MLDLPPEQLAEIRRILSEHLPECEARAFGSRVRGTAREYSDLDLAIVCDNKIPERLMEELRDVFADSGLPIRVDLLDWNSISESFRRVIEGRYEVVREAAGFKARI